MVGLGFTMPDKESDSDAPRQFEKKDESCFDSFFARD